MYDPKSLKAEEFIDHAEILETLDYAEKNKNNKELIEQILEKPARERPRAARNVRALPTAKPQYFSPAKTPSLSVRCTPSPRR